MLNGMAKRGMGAVALSVLLLLGMVPVPGDGDSGGRIVTFPYRDDFDYSPNWTVVEGTWRYHDGVLNGTGYDARELAGNSTWQDVVFSGKFRIASGPEAALLFRATGLTYGENNGRYFQLSNRVGTGVTLYRIGFGRVSEKTAPYSFSPGIWYNFSISLNGSRVDYFLNSSPILNFTAMDYSAGQIGLKAYYSSCHFDDIEVRDFATGELLFSDAFPSNPFGGWDPRQGTWHFSGGEQGLISTGDRNDYTQAPASAPGAEWTARFQMKWTAGTNFETGLFFGFDGPADNYLAYLSASDGTLRIQRTEGGAVNDRWARTAFPVKKGEWYTFTIIKNATGFSLFVNTALVLARNETSPLAGSGFALGSWSAMEERVSFSFIEILEGVVPPKPDLAVNLSALLVNPPRPNPGDEVMFMFGIDNIGTMDSPGNISVELLLDEAVLTSRLLDSIPAGRSQQAFLYWTANLTGNLSLAIAIDSASLLVELNETNNNASFGLTVNEPPVPRFSMIPADGRVEIAQNVQFNASESTDGDGTITAYLWSFGDRTGASVPVTRHHYSAEGTFTVTLNVTDNDGVSRTTSRQVSVRKRVPSANLTWNPARGTIATNFTFRFQLYDPDNTLSGFLWDFGDGNTTADQFPHHRFADDGVYNITFTIFYNSNSNSTAIRVELRVDNLPPEASILSAPAELRKYQPGLFKASASDPDDLLFPLTFRWDFGDGLNATGPEVFHGYNLSGRYRVSLTVVDEMGVNTTLFRYVDVPNLHPTASFAQPPPDYLNTTFIFNGSFSTDPDGSIVNYSWDFGDGQKDYGINVTHNYSVPGNFTVTLTARDDEGATCSTSAIVWVRNKPVVSIPSRQEEAKSPWPAVGVAVGAVIVLAVALAAWWRLRKGEGETGEPPTRVAGSNEEEEQGPGGLQG